MRLAEPEAGPLPFRDPNPPRFPRPPGLHGPHKPLGPYRPPGPHRPPLGRPDYFPPGRPFAGFHGEPFGGPPQRGPHGRPHGPLRGPPHGPHNGPPNESSYGPPDEPPYEPPLGLLPGPPRGPPHRPHGPHRGPLHGTRPFGPRPHRRPPHQGRPSFELDYYSDNDQGTSNGDATYLTGSSDPSAGLILATESSKFTIYSYDKQKFTTSHSFINQPATDIPHVFSTASSHDVYIFSTMAQHPGTATTQWSKEPTYDEGRNPVDVSPPLTRPPWPETSSTTSTTTTTTTTTTTQAPEASPSDGSQIKKYQATCGLSIKSRIVGGEVANKELWSWIAALMRVDKRTNQTEQFCGGVVISNRYVVTAAHCLPGIHPRDLTIRIGEFDFNDKENTRRQDFRVTRIVRHPSFNESNNNFADIALIKIAFNRDLLPVCMPEDDTYEDKEATVLGWGVTTFGGPSSNILMQLTLPVWGNNECQEKLNTVTIVPEFLCAGLKDKGGHDSCQGDSGGPLMVENSNKQWSLIGVVSWGFKCAQKGIPAVYTRVTKFREWIYENAV
ncbi:trypsin-7-like [Tropilaelaps mercedesae]|uniref:Trypsin-7-like n=1 Tax=Tropilaelaps mercedesae TaxID=418985 RepID=A0A1V9XTM2_9ACAR|nr:trypsin-7-like [Tropilaelaps mercedesae]